MSGKRYQSGYDDGSKAGQWAAGTQSLLPLVRELRDVLKQAARLIDELGASPLELAAKYGPDYMPPDIETLAEMRDAVEETAARADKALADAGPQEVKP